MTVSDPLAMAWLEMNDHGNAKRLEIEVGGKLVWVREWGWVAYDGRRWSVEDGERLAMLAAQRVPDGIRAAIDALEAIDDKELHGRIGAWCTPNLREERMIKLHTWATKSGDYNRTVAMLNQAKSLLTANKEVFDREPFALNVLNGTLRVVREKVDDVTHVRFRLDGHDPMDHFTRCCEVDYDPEAVAPLWVGHIGKILPIEPVRDFFQEAIGYGFTGSQREQLFFILQGRGGDGKSTAMDTLRDMAGTYGQTADVKCFLQGPERSGADASPDLFRMQGDTRLICTSEPKRGQALDESRIKAMTGGGKLAARNLHGKEIVEFEPKGKGFMECNSKPRIAGDDDGIWRRMVVILFPYQLKKSELRLGFKEELALERTGILNWVLAGMARWIVKGRLIPPAEVVEAVEDYRRSANPFGEWFNERVDISDPLARQASADFYKDYEAWCEANAVADREKLSSTKFGLMLGDRQLIKWKGGDGRVWRRGGRLRTDNLLAKGSGDPETKAPSPFDDDDMPL